MFKPLLTIIIPTARFSRHLPKTLRYLRRVCKIGDEVEVVIVSTCDNPANRLYERLCKVYIDCKLIVLERLPGQDLRSMHKNLGVMQASSKYIYILDDDAFPTCKLINELLKLLRANKADAVLHAFVPYPISVWAKVRMIEKMLSSFNLERSSCRIIRRDLFIELGGYRENLVLGEDIEFQNRLLVTKPKISIISLDKGFEIHLGEYKTLSDYIRRAFYYGKYIDKTLHTLGVNRALKAFSLLMTSNVVTIYRLYVFPYAIYKVTESLASTLSMILTKVIEKEQRG